MKKLVVILVSVIVLYSSCTKEEDLSKTELLCNSDWKLTAWTVSYTYGGITNTGDVFNNPELLGIPECIFDDYINFDIDGTFSTKPGENICNGALLGSGEWTFNANETVLSITGFNDTIPTGYPIQTLSESTCTLTTIQTIELTDGTMSVFVDGTFTYTFGH